MSFDFSASLYDDLDADLIAPLVIPVPGKTNGAAEPFAAIEELITEPEIEEDEIPANMRKMFVGGLKWETTNESLFNHFCKFGAIEESVVMVDTASGLSRGFGFVTFAHPSILDRVLKQDHTIDGKLVDPKRSVPKDEDPLIAKIFVGGIPIEVEKEALSAFFSVYGVVLDVSLMMDRISGRPRGFGFVTFDQYSSLEAAMVHQRKETLKIHGKRIEIKPATPRNLAGAPQLPNVNVFSERSPENTKEDGTSPGVRSQERDQDSNIDHDMRRSRDSSRDSKTARVRTISRDSRVSINDRDSRASVSDRRSKRDGSRDSRVSSRPDREPRRYRDTGREIRDRDNQDFSRSRDKYDSERSRDVRDSRDRERSPPRRNRSPARRARSPPRRARSREFRR